MSGETFKVPKPNIFDGRRDAFKLDNWLQAVEDYLEATAPSASEHRKVLLASRYLRNHSRTFATNWRADHPTGDWSAFRDGLRGEFYPVNYFENNITAFNSIRQTSSVRDYVVRFRKAINALPTYYQVPQIIRDRFVNSLKKQVKFEIVSRRALTLEDAMGYAQRADDFIFQAAKTAGIRWEVCKTIWTCTYGYRRHASESISDGTIDRSVKEAFGGRESLLLLPSSRPYNR